MAKTFSKAVVSILCIAVILIGIYTLEFGFGSFERVIMTLNESRGVIFRGSKFSVPVGLGTQPTISIMEEQNYILIMNNCSARRERIASTLDDECILVFDDQFPHNGVVRIEVKNKVVSSIIWHYRFMESI